MNTYRTLLLAGMLATGFLPVLPSALAAQRTLVIQDFEAELTVEPSGNVQVTETIRPRFRGSWNGIYRNLSLEHRTADGRRERLDVELLGITNEAGEPLEYEASSQGRWTRRFQIWIPGAEDATRTVVIRYVLHNAIRFFQEGSEIGPLDELYWNATGNEWEIPIEQATVRIVLPDQVAPTQSAGYTGIAGSTETAVRIATRGSSVSFEATRPLGPGEGLTVAVGWPPGTVARPAPASGLVRQAGRWGPLALPFLAFFLAFRQWRRKGKDPEARAIAVQYHPPEGLGPAEVGTLVDHKAEMHDITATLVDLAVRGFVHIQQIEKKTLGVFSSTEYVFHLKKPEESWGGLNTHEELYLRALFKHADRRSPGGGVERPVRGPRHRSWHGRRRRAGGRPGPHLRQRGSLGSEEPVLQGPPDHQESALRPAHQQGPLRAGSRDDQGKVDPRWSGPSGGRDRGGILDERLRRPSPSGSHHAGCRRCPERHRRALLRADHGGPDPPRRPCPGKALGFKEFLERVEEPRYKRMITSPEMFERYLSYAMAFKVESKWAKAFEDMYSQPPQWYSGPPGSGFHASAFAHDLTAMSTAASSTMSSSPSGSGGGGSSGGGSGGGGGGGF